ncbi:MAG: HAD-IB family hydrolase [Acidimicrobiia bacterium]
MTDRPKPIIVAAFDVDGTLTRGDSVVPFLRRATGTTDLVRAFAKRPVATMLAAIRRDRDGLKALAIGALRGRRWTELLALGEVYAGELATGRLRVDTVQRLEWHRERGHRIVLVSASLRPYLVPLGTQLGVDAVLCCEIEVTSDGVVTGRLDGLNCRGAEKVRRLEEWLIGQGLADRAEIWAYGDSAGDRELLAGAARSFFVRGIAVPVEPDEAHW